MIPSKRIKKKLVLGASKGEYNGETSIKVRRCETHTQFNWFTWSRCDSSSFNYCRTIKNKKKQIKQEKKNTKKVIFKRLNLLYIWFYNIILIELYH